MSNEKELIPPTVNLLQHKWCWSYKPTIVYKLQSAEDWMSDYRPLVSEPITTVEQFWAIYDHQPSLATLDYGNIYSMFRDGILPVWEHEANANGYSIVLYLNKTNTIDFITKLYQNSLLILIGNSCDFCGNLNGCTFERKTGGNKVVFWMAKSAGSDRLATVKQIVDTLGIDRTDVTLSEPNARIEWKDVKYSKYKVAIMTRSHQERATEVVPPPKSRQQRQPHHHNNNSDRYSTSNRQYNRK